jgi:Fungal trichothecene efflux pump (TRI12)
MHNNFLFFSQAAPLLITFHGDGISGRLHLLTERLNKITYFSFHSYFQRLNVILSVVAFIIITVFLKLPVEGPSSLRDKVKRIDWLGIAFSILFVVLLLLALSWGGVKYAWNSPHVIACFVASGVSLIILGFVEGYVAKEPVSLFMLKTQMGC